jgi:hypothetical protein
LSYSGSDSWNSSWGNNCRSAAWSLCGC